MDDDLARLVGRAWTAADFDPWAFLTRLTELDDRLGGHAGERRAADLVADALPDAAAPRAEPFEMRRWSRGTTDLAVHAPGLDAGAGDAPGGESRVERSFAAVALPYSPAGEVRAPLVDVGHGTPAEIDEADVAGAVVVARTDSPPGERFVHRMETYGHAAAAGATAFVFANHAPGQLVPTGALGFGREAAVPGVGVSRETGAWLSDYADRGGDAHLRVEATTERATSQNVVGRLGPGARDGATGGGDDGASGPGADTETKAGTRMETDAGAGPDAEVVLFAHYDAHDVGEGALDNGCGVAVVVAAANLLAEMDLGRGVRVAGLGCEEVGLGGSEALAAALDGEVAAAVNVDGAGRGRDLRVYTHGSEALEAIARETVEAHGHPLAVEREPHPYSDHWPFLRAGVPALQVHSESPGVDGEQPGGGRRGRGWTHTAADTRDKVDPRDLREHAVLVALLVRALTRAEPPPRRDPAALAEELRAADAEAGMRAAGIWPDGWD